MNSTLSIHQIQLTAIAPENGWLVQMKAILLGRLGLFSGANWLLVSGSVWEPTYLPILGWPILIFFWDGLFSGVSGRV